MDTMLYEQDFFQTDDYFGDCFNQNDISKALNSLGVECNERSICPMYENLSRRLMSFTYWPIGKEHLVDSIAAAGFYFTGNRDCTMCFSCGAILEDWTEGLDPWTQHALFTDNCRFVRLHKGTDYIKEVKERQKPGDDNVNQGEDQQASEEAEDNHLPMCTLCLGKPRSVVYLPCGHMISCVDCDVMDTCALCKQTVRAYVKAYVS